MRRVGKCDLTACFLRDGVDGYLAFGYTAPMTEKLPYHCIADGCFRLGISKSMCDKHYRRWRRNGNPDTLTRNVHEGNDEERFHQKYIKQDDGCWLWTGNTRVNAKGMVYGRHHAEGKSINAHRFSWQLANGPIPKDAFICHRCDVPLCVNPEHLFCSDHQGNMDDMKQKGRTDNRRGQAKWWRAKLTNEQAEEIRADNTLSQSKIGEKYGISQTTVGRIKRGESY